ITSFSSTACSMPANSDNVALLQRTFKLQNTIQINPLNVGPSWATTSAAACANSCMQLYPDDCQALIFKRSAGLCFIVSFSTDTSSTVTVGDGDLYYISCDISKGFQYVVNGTTRACFGIFGEGNYSVAVAACASKGAVLMSVKTVERLSLLLQLYDEESSIWVGCDDLSQKYTYRWKDDSSVLTNETISQLFTPGQPTYAAGEDCVGLGFRGKLADYTCSLHSYYACEMVI
ncbi:unnamed protein product, partial [Candidula unifasciata]